MPKVYVNHGRWIAECECGNAISFTEPRLWACENCKVLHTVAFPKEREKIDAILSLRPELNRNWLPGETLDDLHRENVEHKKELI